MKCVILLLLLGLSSEGLEEEGGVGLVGAGLGGSCSEAVESAISLHSELTSFM